MKIQNGFSLVPPSAETQAANLDKNLREAAQMYEGHFLNQMVKAMRATVNREGGVLRPNFAEKIFSDQLDSQYVENWSKKGGVGLADMIYDQIRERITASGKQDQMIPKGALPLAPKSHDSIRMKSIPRDSGAGLHYRFEVPDPSGASHEAQAPMPGRVVESRPLSEGWNLIRLDHDLGIESELTFPGQLAQMSQGTDVESGQRLGLLDPSRPVLAWKLEWS